MLAEDVQKMFAPCQKEFGMFTDLDLRDVLRMMAEDGDINLFGNQKNPTIRLERK